MNELDALQQWPAHNVAAGVVNGANTSTTGDVHRVFELASVTKPIVAYGVLVAVEEGVFDLDTPLGPAGSTVRHLLAHASGVGFASRAPERAPGERRTGSPLGGGWDREVAGSASQLQDGVAHQDERAFTATGWAGSQPPPPEPPAYTGAVGRSGIVDAYRPGFDGDHQVAPRYGGVGQDLATAERTFRRHRQDQSRIRSREYCQMPELR